MTGSRIASVTLRVDPAAPWCSSKDKRTIRKARDLGKELVGGAHCVL